MVAVSVTVTIDQAAVNRLVDDPAGPVQTYLGVLSERTADLGARLAPRSQRAPNPRVQPRVGPALADSIVVTPGGNGRPWLVTATAPYSIFVHQGTAPHGIDPRPGNPYGRLFWLGEDGNLVVAKHVNHPGTRPNPFLLAALGFVLVN